MINLINLIKNKSEKSFNQARQCDVGFLSVFEGA